jgi:hypothetical protein
LEPSIQNRAGQNDAHGRLEVAPKQIDGQISISLQSRTLAALVPYVSASGGI